MKLRTLLRRTPLAMLGLSLLLVVPAGAKTDEEGKKKKGESEETVQPQEPNRRQILRVPVQPLEVLRNKVSRIEVFSSNYGIFGLDVLGNRAGGIWPRGSNKAYIFGGGIWFGAEKIRDGNPNKLCVIGYNPNSGTSWMVPGRISGPIDKSKIDRSADAINRYRLYLSSDYSSFSGEPLDNADRTGANWPIWDTEPGDTLKQNRYFGNYIQDLQLRSLSNFPKGPAIISGEDIFSTYKDTDVGNYKEINVDTALKKGYPIGLQIEQTIYSWGFGLYGDFLFIKYTIINKSGENLLNCYMAPALDMDIGAAGNDRARIFIADKDKDTLNLAIQWSEQEAAGQFGYIGFDFLESPAIDPGTGFLRKDKKVFPEREQVGLTTFQSWKIEEDPKTAEQRYNFMSAGDRDGDDGPGDKRFLTATGPFNMAPGDTARVVVGVMFANGKATLATGTEDDVKALWELDTFAQAVYNNNFLAPKAPDPANVTWRPLNNGVELAWDDRSERSLDRQERGADFAGYTIRRQRAYNPNFTPKDTLTGWNIGYKTIGTFEMPPVPDTLTRFLASGGVVNAGAKGAKNLTLLGAWWRLPMLADTLVGMKLDSHNIFRIDTVKRPGLSDSIFTSKTIIRRAYDVKFTFDPYDDNDDDSTHFNDGRFGEQFKNKAVRDVVRDAIAAIMDSVTNNRTFIDVGDDNGDGRVIESETDLEQNEKLINNVDYYYQVLAYDAGSVEGTPAKTNSGIAGINEVRATPASPPAGPRVKPVIIGTNGLAGIHNFQFNVLDDERLVRLFGGDTLDFSFYPVQSLDYNFLDYFYGTEIRVTSRRAGQEVFRFAVNYGSKFVDRADTSFRLTDTVFAQSYPEKDARNLRTTYVGSYYADPIRPEYGTVGIYKNTWGVAFDYAIQQYGDSLRIGRFGDTTHSTRNAFARQAPSGANTNLSAGVSLVGQQATNPIRLVMHRKPSIGQPKVEVEFVGPIQTEAITISKGGFTGTFNVPYMEIKVRNIASYTRSVYNPTGANIDSTVQYNYEFPMDPQARVKADTTSVNVGIARSIDPGYWGMYAFGWMNSDALPSPLRRTDPVKRSKLSATSINDNRKYVGTPGRYYMGSVTTDTVTLKFTHKLVIDGSEIYMDFANMGSIESRADSVDMAETNPTADFQPGDKFTVDFVGGALGLPQPGAKVSVAIPTSVSVLDQYTDADLDQVRIVPNPYLIDHIGQPANTERRLYITRLPDICTIEIYTESGELMQTIEHNVTGGNANDSRVPVEVWDLLSTTNRLSQSQLLIFRITTPNGAETIKKAAVVVGGYRLLNR